MKRDNYQKGRQGEKMARIYLENMGWKTLAQNFKTRWGEIDLVMDEGTRLVFVEVKYKNPLSPGKPEEMITEAKVRQIKMMASVFLEKFPQLAQKRSQWRLDAVCIQRGIKHYQNIDG